MSRRFAGVGLALVLMLVTGCSGGEGLRKDGRAGRGGTTIGRDLHEVPEGSVTPATSLGVDLVARPVPAERLI